MADEDDGDDEAAAADGELNEPDVRAAIARAPNGDRDAEGARPVDRRSVRSDSIAAALDEPIKVGSRKTADLCPDCGIAVSSARLLPQHRGDKRDAAMRLSVLGRKPTRRRLCRVRMISAQGSFSNT